MCLLCGNPNHIPTVDSGGSDPLIPFNSDATDPLVQGPTGDAAPTFTLAQIINQLQTQWGGTAESQGWTFSWAGSNITYSMPNATPTNVSGYTPPEGGSHIVAMTPTMQATARMAFEMWDDLIAPSMTESASTGANIVFNYSNSTSGGGTYEQSWYNSVVGVDHKLGASQVWLNSTWSTHDQDSDLYFGGYGIATYVHEIGHALGLSHPGSYNAGSGGTITYDKNAEFAQDNREFTVMSYFGGYNPQTSSWTKDGTLASWY